MTDYSKYLLIPVKHRGRDYEGADCFGLMRLFYRDELGVQLKDYSDDYDEKWWLQADYFISLHEAYGFRQTEIPSYGDVILFKNNGKAVGHCGIALEDGMFLQMGRYGASISCYLRGVWARSIHSVYTYVGER